MKNLPVELKPLAKSLNAIAQLWFIYLFLTWGYDLVTWVTKTLAAPFVGGV